MTPEIGRWYRIKVGPHRGRSGVCDLIETRRDGGKFYRITNPDMIVGRFPADLLEPCASPQAGYQSQLPAEVTQRAMDLLLAPRRPA